MEKDPFKVLISTLICPIGTKPLRIWNGLVFSPSASESQL